MPIACELHHTWLSSKLHLTIYGDVVRRLDPDPGAAAQRLLSIVDDARDDGADRVMDLDDVALPVLTVVLDRDRRLVATGLHALRRIANWSTWVIVFILSSGQYKIALA